MLLITLLEKLLGKAEPLIGLIPEKFSPSLGYIYGGKVPCNRSDKNINPRAVSIIVGPVV